jgi:heme-degrading monooxygenase HmoA
MPIWEVFPVTVKSWTEDYFEAAFRSNLSLLANGKGCLDVKLLRAVDKQNTFMVLVQWASVENHTAFTKSDASAKFRSATGPFFAAPPDLFHAITVIDGFLSTSQATPK